MPTEFQKAMDCTLKGLEGIICYLDDILIVTKGDVQEHDELIKKGDAKTWCGRLGFKNE